MLAILGVLFGALVGTMTARRRNGSKLDQLQYACGYGIAFGLLGVFLGIVAGWLSI